MGNKNKEEESSVAQRSADGTFLLLAPHWTVHYTLLLEYFRLKDWISNLDNRTDNYDQFQMAPIWLHVSP